MATALLPAEGLLIGLRRHAAAHGIDAIGVTTPDPITTVGWRKRTTDPRRFLPGAKALVVAAFGLYERPVIRPRQPGIPRGRFSRMYRSTDPTYRYVVRVIEEFLTSRGYNCADTQVGSGDIPHKVAAARAGLGSYGKNCVVHVEGLGSWCMFASVITDAPLPTRSEDVFRSECGDCDSCQRACPTGALAEPYRLNPRRCICAWLWGMYPPVPRRLRPHVENRLFGCGACLEACPLNAGVRPREAFPAGFDGELDDPDLLPLLAGGEEAYRASFGGFALLAGVENLRRNVIMALGNAGDAAAVPHLAALAVRKGVVPLTACYAAWALGRIGTPAAVAELATWLDREESPDVRREIAAALREARSPSS